MTKPTSYAKGAMGDGKSAQSSKSDFKAATAGQSQQATAKAAEPKPRPQQAHNMKGPGGNAVTQQAAQKQMGAFKGQEDAKVKALKERANAVTARQDAKAHGKLKGKDDLQK